MNSDMWSPDTPLLNPEGDKLGYNPFAQNLATAISRMTPSEGLVLAIYGPWGTGKSTVLNFMKHYLQESDQSDVFRVVHFNPWWFAGSDDLVSDFFGQMIASIDSSTERNKEIRRNLSLMADVLSKMPIPYVNMLEPVGRLIKPKEINLAEAKSNLEKLLVENDIKYVVIVDDIDRLSNDEIRQLFRVVKAIANLPNIIYVMAFDKHVVANALGRIYESSGKEYLEKIVQVPFELPLPDTTSINQMLFDGLDSILGNKSRDEFDQHYWANIFLDGIQPLVQSPRDVVRLCNALSVSFPAVEMEVNSVDFIAIEAIRLFLPEIYDVIRSNPAMFTGLLDRELSPNRQEELEFHEAYLEKIDSRLVSNLKNLLQRLFPRLHAVFGNMNYSPSFMSNWRSQKRICSGDNFSIYFRLSLEDGAIGFREIDEFISIAGDKDRVKKALYTLAGQNHPSGITRAHALAQRLEDYTERKITSEKIEPIITAIFDVADSLHEKEPETRGFYDFGVELQLGRIFYQLVSRLSSLEKYRLIRACIEKGEALSFIEREIAILGQMHGKHGKKEPEPDENQLVSRDQLNELEKIAANRFYHYAKDGKLIKSPFLAHILRGWREWDRSRHFAEWLDQNNTKDDFIVYLLSSALQVTHSFGMGFDGLGDRVSRKSHRIDLDFIRWFVNTDEIEPNARRLLEGDGLSERQRKALEVFIRESDKERKDKAAKEKA